MLKKLSLLLIVGVSLSACQKAQQREKILNGRAAAGGSTANRLGNQSLTMAGECLNLPFIITTLKGAEELVISPYDFQIFRTADNVTSTLQSESNLKVKAAALLEQRSEASSSRRRITIAKTSRSEATGRSRVTNYFNSLLRSSQGSGDISLTQSNDCSKVVVTRGGATTDWEIVEGDASTRATTLVIQHEDTALKLTKLDNSTYNFELTEKIEMNACGTSANIIKKTTHRVKATADANVSIKRGLFTLLEQIAEEAVPSAVDNADGDETVTITQLQESPIGSDSDSEFQVNCGN